MLIAELVDVVDEYAPLIGITLAVLITVAVPPLRRGVIRAFLAGKKAGEEARDRREKKKKDND